MKKIVVLLLAFLISSVAAANAQPEERMSHPQRGGLLKDLNLTQEQEKQFNEINYQHQKKMIEFRSQLDKNRLEIKKLLNESKLDEEKLFDYVEANNKIHSDMKLAVTEKWVSIYKILNDEQKEIWKKHFMFNNMGGMKGKFKEWLHKRMR